MENDKFHQRFNTDLGGDEARRRFVNRANNLILHELLVGIGTLGIHSAAAEAELDLCNKLGEKYKGCGCLATILGDDFQLHLRALEGLYESTKRTWADKAAIQLLDECEIDIGLRWIEGKFRPSGSRLLDEKLIDDVLGLLKSPAHEGVLKPFLKGLDHFLHSTKNPAQLFDVVTDMYESLEAMAKNVNNNDKELSANREAFVARLRLSEPYKRMLKGYVEYANDFARHAGEKGQAKPVPSRREVEAFIYQTGLVLRLALSDET